MRKTTTVTDIRTAPGLRPVTIGVDLGDRRSHACVLDGSRAEVVARFSFDTTAQAIEDQMRAWKGARAVIEAGTHSPWVSRLLDGLGLRVIVANPNKLALISKSHTKTDRADAELLARLGNADLALLRPLEHRSETLQAHLELLKARDAVVRSRTLTINHVRGALKSFGVRAPACDADTFASKAPDHVPAALALAILPMLDVIRLLTKSIRRYDREAERLCKEVYRHTSLLRQVDGVGPLTSLAFVLVLGKAERFKKSRQVGPYLGLCPKVSQSGDHNPQLHISKAGNGFLRKLLVQAAHYITGPFGEDCTLRRVGLRLMASQGPRGKKRAVVAVARRLAVMLHRMWRTGEVYEPLRHAPELVASTTPA